MDHIPREIQEAPHLSDDLLDCLSPIPCESNASPEWQIVNAVAAALSAAPSMVEPAESDVFDLGFYNITTDGRILDAINAGKTLRPWICRHDQPCDILSFTTADPKGYPQHTCDARCRCRMFASR